MLEILSIGAVCKVKTHPNGDLMVAHFPTQWLKQLVVGGCCTVMNFTTDFFEGEIHIHVDPSKGASILIHPNPRRGGLQVAEIFGGIAGWSEASALFGCVPKIVVEKDEGTAQCCAKKLQCEVMKAEDYVNQVLHGNNPDKVVLCDNVNSRWVWMALTLANCDCTLGSPPCQPWSTAGKGLGLQSEDGMIFSETLQWGASADISVMLMENVPGFAKHEDFPKVVSRAMVDGWKMPLYGVFQCGLVRPILRDRWLGTFVQRHVTFEDSKAVLARAIDFTNHSFKVVARSPSMQTADVVHVNMSQDEREKLLIQPNIQAMMRDPKLAPKWLRKKCCVINEESVWNGRAIQTNQQMNGVMASYGSQHEIPKEQLAERGLQTTFVEDQCGPRMISPWEMVAALGYSKRVVLPFDQVLAYKIAGNGLSIAHAWLQIHKTTLLLGSQTPFSFGGDVCQHVMSWNEVTIPLAKMEVVHEDGFQFLKEIQDEHVPKRQKIESVSPTIAFHVDEDHSGGCHAFAKMPQFQLVNDPRMCAAGTCESRGGLVMVQHQMNNWMSMVNVSKVASVGDIIQMCLPHAVKEDFERFMHHTTEVKWDQFVECIPMCTLRFCPVFSVVTCQEESLKLAISLQIDVTWTVGAVKAFVAAKIGCVPEVLMLKHDDLDLGNAIYLHEYKISQMQVKFKAVMPGYVEWASVAKQIGDAGLAPAPHAMCRFFARHPAKKTIRTLAILPDQTVGQLVRDMFPDIHASVTWAVFVDGKEINSDTMIGNDCRFEIQWNGFRPLSTTDIMKLQIDRTVDSVGYQALQTASDIRTWWIRTPFKTKPLIVKIPQDAEVGEIGASFFAGSQVNTNVVCHVGGMIVDPKSTFADLSNDAVVSFRVCPLVGGGKHEGLKQRMKQMLEVRGVETSTVGERINAFCGKANLYKLEQMKDGNEDELWDMMKKTANECQFRLITHQELKEHQQKQRKQKPVIKGGHGEKEHKRSFVSHADDLVVDSRHFKDGDDAIEMLDKCRFGPDQTGLAIMNASEVRKNMHTGLKSCDALAALVVDRDLTGFDDIIHVPAYTKKGMPIITTAALVNFGDRPIRFAAEVPKVVCDPIQATTIEFFIVREYTSRWADTTVPLHFLGVQVPSLRGQNLLSTWSIKAWSNSKKVCGHGDAAYWHGYFRIYDNMLPAVLSRSGANGVFFNPKTADKKHDNRYAVVLLPVKQINEALQKAEICQHAMGVVRIGDQFGVRCKREHVDEARAALLPESAFVETAAFGHEHTLYILRNVSAQFGRENLSAALKSAGWDAVAVKPQGLNRWVIAAKCEPKASHLAINDTLAIVEKMNKPKEIIPFTLVSKEVQQCAFVDAKNQVAQVSTMSRISEVKAEIEASITDAVEQRLAVANSKIEELSNALAKTQAQQQSIVNDMAQVKDEHAFTRQKMQEVETAVSPSSQQIMNQMQSLFTSMQSNIEQTVVKVIQQQQQQDDSPTRERSRRRAANGPGEKVRC